jgi:ribosomal-protein-alanine N-acetyltransferase
VVWLDAIRSFLLPQGKVHDEAIVPAPFGEYSIRPLTDKHIEQVLAVNSRCFVRGDSYTRYAFEYLLSNPNTLSYRVVTEGGELAGFVFVIVSDNGAAHLTTIGVAPEHRRRGLARRLLQHTEAALLQRSVNTIVLEVRVSNLHAQQLYRSCGYYVVQRINRYYSDGEDCFLMIKPLVVEAALG